MHNINSVETHKNQVEKGKIEIFNYFETFFYLNIGKELPYGKFMPPAPSLESWLTQERENFSRRYMRGVNPLFTFLKESNLV